MHSRETKSAPVGVVSKVLRILETLDVSPNGLQLRQIATQTSIHKSTAYRFLAHLENDGYLYRDEEGAYIIAPKLARLGSGIPYHATIRKVSRPILQSIWKTTGETVNLGVMEGFDVLYLDVLESAHQFRLVSEVGVRRPMNCTALGKAILAFLPLEERDEIFSALEFKRFTRHTIRDLSHLKSELAKARKAGHAVDEQETVLGARCVAAPIMDQSGKVTGAISVSGPVTRVTRNRAQSHALVVKEGARRISELLGYSPARTRR